MKFYEQLTEPQRETLFLEMRRIDRELHYEWAKAQSLHPVHGEIAVGSAYIDPQIRGDALFGLIQGLRNGLDIWASVENGKDHARQTVRKHRERIPDYTQHRSEETADSFLQSVGFRLQSRVFPNGEQQGIEAMPKRNRGRNRNRTADTNKAKTRFAKWAEKSKNIFAAAAKRAKEEKPFSSLDDGNYIARLTGAEVRESGNGNLGVFFEWTVVEGDSVGDTGIKFCGIEDEDQLTWLNQEFIRLGMEPVSDGKELQQTLDELLEDKPKARIRVKTKKDSDYANLYIRKILEDKTDDADYADIKGGEDGDDGKTSRRSRAADDDPEPAEPAAGDDGDGGDDGLTEDDIKAMSKSELKKLIEDEDLDVDPDDSKLAKVDKLRDAVMDAYFDDGGEPEDGAEVIDEGDAVRWKKGRGWLRGEVKSVDEDAGTAKVKPSGGGKPVTVDLDKLELLETDD